MFAKLLFICISWAGWLAGDAGYSVDVQWQDEITNEQDGRELMSGDNGAAMAERRNY